MQKKATLTIKDLDLPMVEAENARYRKVRFAQPGVVVEPQQYDFDPSKGEWEYNLSVTPRGLPWLIVEFRTAEPNPETKDETLQPKAMFQIPLRTGKYDVTLYDPSLSNEDLDSDEYSDIGSATVMLDVPFEIPDYMKRIDSAMAEIARLAKAERKESFEIWVRRFRGDIANIAIQWYYLQKYTTKAHNVVSPAYYYMELARLVPAASEEYIDRLYRSVAEIHGTGIDEIKEILDRPVEMITDTEFLMLHRVLADILTIPANSHTYVSDHAGLLSVERFSMGCYEGMVTGDCEDLGMVIILTFYAFLKSDKLPSGLRKLMNGFKPLLVTGAASNKKLDNLSAMTSGFICHVWAFLIPKHQVRSWKGENSREGLDMKFQERLWPILGEGTNFADPMAMEIPYYIEDDEGERDAEIARIRRKLLNNAEISQHVPVLKSKVPIRFAPLDKELKNPDELSRFYCYVVSAAMLPDDIKVDAPILWNFKRKGKNAVQPYYILRMDPEIKMVAHTEVHKLTLNQRCVVAAFNGTPARLAAPKGPIVLSQKGDINRDNMAEFRFKSLAELNGAEPWKDWPKHRLIKVSITSQLQVFVLQVTPQ